MSIYPSPDKLDNLESKYALVILAAKRARQIKDGAKRLIETKSTNPLTIALEEIAAGAVISRVVEDPTVAAHQAALKPNEPSLEDIIGAGPVLVLDEVDAGIPPLEVLRAVEGTLDDEEVSEEDGVEALRGLNFSLDEPELVTGAEDEDDDLIPGDEDEEEEA